VDQDWLREWQEAQTHRPATLAAQARIAPASEPGTPLRIAGEVLQPDGVTPEVGAIVFAYHTDTSGVYRAKPGLPWRLRGWVRTDAAGRFAFDTIRPAPYPGRQVPAHVHLTVESDRFGRQHGGLQFADDPLVPPAEREAARAKGRFTDVLDVRHEGQAQRVDLVLKLKPRGDF
jgi:protocatechuate 3,4-dioxygenase beta subunit